MTSKSTIERFNTHISGHRSPSDHFTAIFFCLEVYGETMSFGLQKVFFWLLHLQWPLGKQFADESPSSAVCSACACSHASCRETKRDAGQRRIRHKAAGAQLGFFTSVCAARRRRRLCLLCLLFLLLIPHS